MDKVYYVGCFLTLPNERYVFQQRDSDFKISNPGVISTFGGRAEIGEDALTTLRREMREELALDIDLQQSQFVGYAERYDETKGHIAGCSYYLYPIEEVPAVCNEGALVIIESANVANNKYVGSMTKEMFMRVK